MQKNIIILFFILLIGCGYKPIYSTNNVNFTINEIEFNRNGLNKIIYNNLSSYKDKQSKKFIYDIKINSTEEKVTTLKDLKGNPSNFRLSVFVNIEVYEDDKLKMKKDYVEVFDYENTSKKFELKQYENQIKISILDKISDKIITDLYLVG
tara:strand:- start:393 stop:845 length:453 start_codon:yes stop_codon:yes gene_type:complete